MSSSLVFATVVEVFHWNNLASSEATATDWMVEYQNVQLLETARSLTDVKNVTITIWMMQ